MSLWDKLKQKDNTLYKVAENTQNIPNPYNVAPIIYKNFVDMENSPYFKNKDKWYHANINCELGKRYNLGGAIVGSLGKELVDVPQKVHNGMHLNVALNDSLGDLWADGYGLTQGMLNPFGNCSYLIDQNYIDEKFK